MLFKPYIERSNMEQFIRIPKFYLLLMGIWPLGETKFAWIYYFQAMVFSYGISILFTISMSIDMYFKVNDLAAAAAGLYYYLTEMGFVIKLLIFTYNRKKFINLLDDIENPLFVQHRPDQEKYLNIWSNRINTYCHVFLGTCYLCVVFYSVVPIIDSDPEHILPFSGWFPFDVHDNIINRRAVYLFQISGLIVAIMINASMDILPAACMNISCAQLEILRDNLESATREAEKSTDAENLTLQTIHEPEENFCELLTKKADDIVHDTLVKCIMHHQAVIKFLSKVESVFNLGMFVQFIESGVTICITALQLIVVQSNLYTLILTLAYLGAVLLEIICYTWNGHLVTILSTEISDSCYNMDWYRCSAKVRRLIFIIMERCKRPIQMTAGNIFILSIQTLTALLRTAYSYFAILRKVYDG